MSNGSSMSGLVVVKETFPLVSSELFASGFHAQSR
jgi:hypothetical protein